MCSPADAAAIGAACRLLGALPCDTPVGVAEMQGVIAAMLRVYAARAAEDETLSPLPSEGGVTQTDAMLAASGILRASNLQLFELGMWQAWSGRG